MTQIVVAGARVVEIARGFLGTPYHHQASRRGAGCDCLGLVRGIWRELYGVDAAAPPAYSRDWAEARGAETLTDAASAWLVAKSIEDMQPGDVLVFRYRAGLPAKHCAIASSEATMIHALERAGVVEVPLAPWWRRRIAGVFAFPELT